MGSFFSLFVSSLNDQDEAGPSLLELLLVGAHDDEEDHDNVNNEDPNHPGNHGRNNTNSTPNWDAIERRLRRHPEEAAAFGHSIDPSPLSRALQKGPPVSVVRAFLDAYEDAVFHTDQATETSALLAAMQGAALVRPVPDTSVPRPKEDLFQIVKLLLNANEQACRQPDRKGRLPIHFVRTCPKTAKLLMDAHPSAITQTDTQGRLALHYCCECSIPPPSQAAEPANPNDEPPSNAQVDQPWIRLAIPDPRVVEMLLSHSTLADGGISVKDKGTNPISPLEIIYQEIQKELESINHHSKLETESKASDNIQDHQHRLDALWTILVLLVQRATDAAKDNTPRDNTSTKISFRLVHALVSLHSPVSILMEALRRMPHQAVERDEQGRTPLLLAAGDIFVESAVICALIQFNPQAARMMDRDGRLPIDLVAENPNVSDSDVLEAIVRAEPRAVDTRDLKYHRHPFLTAAIAGAHQGSIYHLLRAQPHVIKHFLQETD